MEGYSKLRKANQMLKPTDMALAECYGEQLCTTEVNDIRGAEKLWWSAKMYCDKSKLNISTDIHENLETNAYDTVAHDDGNAELDSPYEPALESSDNISISLSQLSAFAFGVVVASGMFYVYKKFHEQQSIVRKTLRRPEL